MPAVEEYLYEILAEQGRAKSVGKGLYLATAHAVKGLEFDHVFILGESWHNGSPATLEDERRLYYVSMSRARETLHLFSLPTVANPHLALLEGDFLLGRKVAPLVDEQPARRTYHLLGLEDFFIDFAGIKAERHPARQTMERMVAGEPVRIQQRNSHLEIIADNGVAFARLSKKAREEWGERLEGIRALRVVALVRRYRDDVADKAFQTRCKGDSWTVPIVEIIC